MTKIRVVTSLVLASMLAFSAKADSLVEGVITGQINIKVDDSGNLGSCGITLAAIETPKTTNPNERVLIFNGSFAVYGIMGGLVKGRGVEIQAKEFSNPNFNWNTLKPLPVTNVWLKAQGEQATAVMPGQRIEPSPDDPGYIIYIAPLKPLFAMAMAISNDEPIQIGVQVQGRKLGQAVFGKVQLSKTEREQFNQCMSEWLRIQAKKAEEALPNGSSHR